MVAARSPRLTPWLLATLLSAPVLLFSVAAHAQEYDISLDFVEPLHASVQATLLAPDGKLFTHAHAGGYQWSDYITNLHVFRKDGAELVLQSTTPGQWTLNKGTDEPIRVTYDVDLAFTKQLREGTQRGGQFFGHALYLVNRALFVMSDRSGPITVRFAVPADFKIATPWKAIAPFQYRVQDRDELADNTTILGDFPTFQIREGNFHLTMALPGTTRTGQSLLEPVMQSALHEYIRMLPRTPEFRILLTYFRGVEVNGEGYRNSATLTSADPIEQANRVMWANYLDHEFFHHWNATLIEGKDDGPNVGTTEWFAEGATEYIANRTLVRTGTISRDTYIRMLETNIGLYEFWMWAAPFQGASPSVSLQDAGSKTALPSPKGTVKTYNRAGIYNGGWVATYCIDMMIQHHTSGRKGVDDLFRVLLDKYGLTGKHYTVADLAQSASDVAGTDLSSFFQEYVAAPNPLPVRQCLKQGGYDSQILNYAGDAFVTPSAAATALERTIRNQLLGGR